ncbi:MAG: ABC transporter permease subunit [Candidatus Lokiarchaeota archaeon]|nr:ABC transporter permease subunit [Candidatus Lokiarchaeota archaeon]
MVSILKNNIVTEQINIERQKVGLRRDIMQINNTISFELKRNFRRFIVLLIVYAGIFFLSLLMNELLYDLMGEFAPTDSISLMQNYIGQFFILALIISAAMFGGSIIAEDFYRQTGNLLFPKISKTRLLVGRLISRYILNALCILFFYVLVATTSFIKYQEVDLKIFYSIGWALLYSFVLLCFVSFLSSFMKNTSFTIITSILFLLIVMQMVPVILSYSGVVENNEIPMFFIFSYFGNIISECLNMPAVRYETITHPPALEYSQWSTPSEFGAALGMIIYIIIFLTLAYILYQRRQSKSE